VNYQSKDSIVYDAKKKQLFLHNKAEINYDDINVKADYIRYNQDSSILSAIELKYDPKDSSEKPRLSQGAESSTFSTLQYNFKSKRALVENAYSQYGEGFILSNQVKRNNDNTINGYRNIYTTCNDEHPHFGISAKKIKIIPNKVAVTGSANLVIEDIPTPLYLPFGMFPLQKGQRSGFKLPTYDMSQNLGFGLREFGYYFAINDHIDLLTTADIYALGTYRVGFITSYAYRYRFNGNMNFNYSYTKTGEAFEANSQKIRNYSIVWNHSINQNVLPGTNFNASVNIVNNRSYQLYNTYDANTYLNNNYSSSISYTKTWEGKPFNFSAALRHNQNTQSRVVQVTLPDISFTVNQLFPFQFRKEIIKPKWYEKIGASYQFNALNRLDFFDSSFSISNLKWNDFQNGFKHSVPINASYNVLKFFNSSFNFNYDEYWYTKRNFKSYNFTSRKLDTIGDSGFFTARNFSLSTALSTRIYGIKLFKKGAIKGIRHVLTPSVNLRYQPDFGGGIGNYYYNTFIDSNRNYARYSYYADGLLGGPPDGKFGGIGFGLGNTLQLKVKNKKDTISGTRKINLIDGFDIGGSYNFVVDSFKWSYISMRYRTNLLENINISGSISFDPYSINKENGRRSAITNYEANGKILKFNSADLAIRASLPVKRQNSALNKATDEQKEAIGNNYGLYTDFNIPWNLEINYSIGIRKNYLVKSKKDTLELDQNLLVRGDINLTEKWRIGFSSGYEFRTKQLTYSSFDIFRDLHCWEMKLGLIPFGPRKSYNFSLNVKSSVLQDLKLVRRKDFRDNLQ
jgi:lipopolysaccharide assembly outer membrane protein LptD (OstA)